MREGLNLTDVYIINLSTSMRTYFNLPFILSALVFCFLPMWTHAGLIGIEQSRQTAETFRKNPAHSGRHRTKLTAGALPHAFTQNTAAGVPAVYVFNKGNGFVLPSADNATAPIQGFPARILGNYSF